MATTSTTLNTKILEVVDPKTLTVAAASSLNTLISSQLSSPHTSSRQTIFFNVEAATPFSHNAIPSRSSTPSKTRSAPSSKPLATI